MHDLFGCRVSARTVANIVRECASGLVETELQIKQQLRRSPVIHADETGLRINKRLGYVHVASTPHLTHYAAATHRGQTAITEINVLPRYRGTCVHDGWQAYTHCTRCRHALCGVHLLREFTYFEELCEETKAWARPLKELLLEMKREVELVREGSERRLDHQRLTALTESYERMVADGLHTPPPEVPAQVCKQERNLLQPLERRKEEVLLFLTDISVPFDNNQAERDLRMVKLQQKVYWLLPHRGRYTPVLSHQKLSLDHEKAGARCTPDARRSVPREAAKCEKMRQIVEDTHGGGRCDAKSRGREETWPLPKDVKAAIDD